MRFSLIFAYTALALVRRCCDVRAIAAGLCKGRYEKKVMFDKVRDVAAPRSGSLQVLLDSVGPWLRIDHLDPIQNGYGVRILGAKVALRNCP